MSTNDRRTQMRLNIKWHRQKRLQRIECTDDTHLKPKIKSVSNDIEKSHLNYNTKPKIQVINPEPSVTVKKKLSDQLIEEIKYYDDSDDSNGESIEDSITVKKELSDQLIEEIKYYDGSDNSNGGSIEDSLTVKKKLSDQLIEEIKYYDGSDDSYVISIEDSDDDNISVGTEDWNEAFQIHNESDLDENNKRNLKTTVQFDGPQVNDEINKTYLDNNDNSSTPVLDVNEPITRTSRRTRKNINYFEKHRKIPQPKIKKLSMKRKEKKRIGGEYVQRKKMCQEQK